MVDAGPPARPKRLARPIRHRPRPKPPATRRPRRSAPHIPPSGWSKTSACRAGPRARARFPPAPARAPRAARATRSPAPAGCPAPGPACGTPRPHRPRLAHRQPAAAALAQRAARPRSIPRPAAVGIGEQRRLALHHRHADHAHRRHKALAPRVHRRPASRSPARFHSKCTRLKFRFSPEIGGVVADMLRLIAGSIRATRGSAPSQNRNRPVTPLHARPSPAAPPGRPAGRSASVGSPAARQHQIALHHARPRPARSPAPGSQSDSPAPAGPAHKAPSPPWPRWPAAAPDPARAPPAPRPVAASATTKPTAPPSLAAAISASTSPAPRPAATGAPPPRRPGGARLPGASAQRRQRHARQQARQHQAPRDHCAIPVRLPDGDTRDCPAQHPANVRRIPRPVTTPPPPAIPPAPGSRSRTASFIGTFTKAQTGGCGRASVSPPRHPVHPEHPRRHRQPRRHPRPRPRQHPHRHRPQDIAPAVPAVELHQIVRPHQPDEGHARIDRPQPLHRVGRGARAQPRLQRGDLHPRVPHHRPRPRHPVGHRRRLPRLQRVAGGDQPPDLIQPKPLHRLARDMGMPLMRRIERPAQQADDHARSSQCGKPARISPAPCFAALPAPSTGATGVSICRAGARLVKPNPLTPAYADFVR